MKTIKVLIMGGGFAGLETAILLKKIMKEKASVTLIDKGRYHVFIPSLQNYLIKEIGKKDIAVEFFSILKKRGINFLRGYVKEVNLKNKKVYIKNMAIPYDYLVISIGSETNDHGIKGVEKNTFKFKTLKDAEDIRKKINELSKLKENFKIVVVGAGLTGIQLVSYLEGYLEKKFPENKIKLVLLNSSKRILDKMPEEAGKKVRDYIKKRKITFYENSSVVRIDKNKIYLKSKKSIDSDLIIWAAGIKAKKDIKKFGLEYCNEGLYVNEYFQTSSKFIYALGDCISFKDSEIEKRNKKRAQTAFKQGKLVARNIVNDVFNKKKIAYAPKEIPSIISLYCKPIFNYKKIIVQSRFICLVEKIIRIRHVNFYRLI